MKNLNLITRKVVLCLTTFLLISSACSQDEDNDRRENIDLSDAVGCIDPSANNYDAEAGYSDNSCTYEEVGCDDCDHVLEATEWKLDNDELNLAPGSKIGIRGGERRDILIKNFKGTSEAPFIFTNCEGKSSLTRAANQEAIRIQNSEYIRVTGTGSSDEYGIVISHGSNGVRAYEKTREIEIDHIEVSGVQVGIWVVTRPKCDGSANKGNFDVTNVSIHHNYIHDVNAEGMYVGGSFWHSSYQNDDCSATLLYQAELKGVHIFNNRVENTGWDGIQVGSAIEGTEIYNNIVRNYGLENVEVHQAGFMINPGTTGKIFSNLVEGGTGNGIFIVGFDILAYSNLILDCNKNAIHIGDRSPQRNKSYRIVNNTIVNTLGRAIHSNSTQSIENDVYNNLIVNVADDNAISAGNNTRVDNNVILTSLEESVFEDNAEFDFTPALSSSLLDSGSVYERDELILDFLMRKRMVGANLDVGAFENQDE